MGTNQGVLGPEGAFRAKRSVPGEYKVTVSAEGFVPATVEASLGEGDIVEHSFTLLRAGVIEGMITDAQTGEPIPRARIRLVAASPSTTEAETPNAKEPKGVPRVGDGSTKRVGPKKTEAELAAEDIEAVRNHYSTRFRNPIRSEQDGSFSIDSAAAGGQMLIVTHDDYVESTMKNVSVEMGRASTVHWRCIAGFTSLAGSSMPAGSPRRQERLHSRHG